MTMIGIETIPSGVKEFAASTRDFSFLRHMPPLKITSMARNRKVDDPATDEQIRIGISAAFKNEDEAMIAECYKMMGTSDLMSLAPVLLSGDAPALRATHPRSEDRSCIQGRRLTVLRLSHSLRTSKGRT